MLRAVSGLAAFVVAMAGSTPLHAAPHKINFDRDIRPVLSENCYACHGPDPAKCKSGLRLDMKDSAYSVLKSGDTAIVPGDISKSSLIDRITTDDEDDIMPPPKSNKHLTPEQIANFKQWIAEGAQFAPHWSFVTPVRPELPAVKEKGWPRNGLDHFVLANLEEAGLRPSAEADKITLIRRATLDLTGIPPTPAEVDAFIADESPDAYEHVIDRLLASPRYGERMAQQWVDGARYADSNGYQADYERFMWRWRDWLIDAYNANMPFDKFTTEQLAGDLMPNHTMDQVVATGFCRNHRINTEGGSIAEEWRTETVIDRVETMSNVFLGLTTGCARCHDHKYDPITQREFYQLYSFFNNVPESGSGEEKSKNHPPVIQAPRPFEQEKLAELTAAAAKALQTVKEKEPLLPGLQVKWEEAQANAPTTRPAEPAGLVVRFPLDGSIASTQPSAKGTASTSPVNVAAHKFAPGLIGKALVLDGKPDSAVNAGECVSFDRADHFTISCWIKPGPRGGGAIVSKIDVPSKRGFELVVGADDRVSFDLLGGGQASLKAATKAPIARNVWSHVAVTYGGTGKVAGVVIYVNGKPAEREKDVDRLGAAGFKSPAPVTLGARPAKTLPWTGALADVRFYNRTLNADEIKPITDGPEWTILKIPSAQRSKDQLASLSSFFRANFAGEVTAADKAAIATRKAREDFDAAIPTLMVMAEMPKPREAHILIRGQYDHPGDPVKPGTPSFLPPMPKGAPMNRLGLAQWIMDPANPLTARVAANRFWERFFGVGIVKTSENMGAQADWPSNPELLDWLATEFIRQGWDMKAFQKMILMSATYRQSSKLTPELAERDPENRMLARGPRFRLAAEVIRDQALAISGLLVDRIGGPSVRPYQPEGIWNELTVYGNLRDYKHDVGDNLYRRSLYTIWKRTAAPPLMTLFDCPGREISIVRRSRTNTPLQALALLNEETFVESSRVLGQRMMAEGGSSPLTRIRYGFRLATSRAPSDAEMKLLNAGLEQRLAKFHQDPAAAKALVSIGDAKVPPAVDVPELAAYTMTANVILNLDETITKE